MPWGFGDKRLMPMIESPEVLLPGPLARFIPVSAPRPAPERMPNVVIHRRVRPLSDDVSMVVRPAPDHGVEQTNQGFLLRGAVRPNDISDIIQERFHILDRRLD